MEIADLPEDVRSGNVAKIHDHTAEVVGDLPALRTQDRTITHEELARRSAEFAGGLHDLGIEEDDRVLLYLINGPEFLVSALGCFKAGVPYSPVNPQYKAHELSYQLEDTHAKAIVTREVLRENVSDALERVDMQPEVITVGEEVPEGDVPFDDVRGEPTIVERSDDDVAMQPYTSGTTGQPKGVRLTHKNLGAHSLYAFATGEDRDPEDIRSLLYLPLYHITGFVHTTWQPLLLGGTIYLRNPLEWDAETCMQTIEDEEITSFVGVTAMFVDIVNHERFDEYDLTSLESVGEGGAKMSVSVQEKFEETAGVEMGEGYGMTETCGATHSSGNSSHGIVHGKIGQPLRFTDSKIVDEDGEEVMPGETGELLVRGPMVMDGYHNMPEATEESFTERGYLKTGDIARRDVNNYYEIVDRKKHMIVSAGYNIYPSEVEEFLYGHDAVAEAAVVGVPDERRNEVPIAFVVPAPGVEPGEDVTEEDLKQYCLDNMAEYKHPREVGFVDELPRTTSGKIQKFKLEEQAEE